MKYIIYAFINAKGEPYYIGKTGNYERRFKDHLFEVKTKNPLPKYQKARELFGKGHKFKMKKLAQAVSEEDAYLIERAFIKDYMKRGFKLTNLTKGGPDEEPLKLKQTSKLGRTSTEVKKSSTKKKTKKATTKKKPIKRVSKIKVKPKKKRTKK